MTFLGANVKVALDLSNHAKKSALKNATGVDTSDFAKKNNWANSKFDVDKLDIDKLKNVPNGLNSLKSKVDKLDNGKFETTPIDLNKLSNVAKKYVLKNTEHNKLVKKADNIKTSDTFDLVKKNYNT